MPAEASEKMYEWCEGMETLMLYCILAMLAKMFDLLIALNTKKT